MEKLLILVDGDRPYRVICRNSAVLVASLLLRRQAILAGGIDNRMGTVEWGQKNDDKSIDGSLIN